MSTVSEKTIVHAWEGDCAQVLPALAERWSGRVDAVYVDPPYNVGIAGHYLDRREDWPGFIAASLRAATPLLAPTAVVVISVGDAELPRLRLLAQEVYGPRAYLGTVHWSGGGSPGARYLAGGVDHMVLLAPDRTALDRSGTRFTVAKPGVAPVLAACADAWAASPGDARAAGAALRSWWAGLSPGHPSKVVPGLRRYMRVDAAGRCYRGVPLDKPKPRPGHRYDIPHPVTGLACKVPGNGWRMTEATMLALLAAGGLHFGPDHGQSPQGKKYLADARRAPLPSALTRRRTGTADLTELIGAHDFPYPKDPQVISWLLEAIAGPDALVLDFFAGSGTTAQAVAQSNARDGGTRTALLVTNSESYQDYLLPRLRALPALEVRQQSSPDR